MTAKACLGRRTTFRFLRTILLMKAIHFTDRAFVDFAEIFIMYKEYRVLRLLEGQTKLL